MKEKGVAATSHIDLVELADRVEDGENERNEAE